MKAISLITSIQRIASLNSMQSKMVNLAVDARDVAKMQVAVALADESATLPPAEFGATGVVLALGP